MSYDIELQKALNNPILFKVIKGCGKVFKAMSPNGLGAIFQPIDKFL